MSLDYRKKRIENIASYWSFKKENDFMASYEIEKRVFDNFKRSVKFYISKAMGINFIENDKEFITELDKNRDNLKNVTPNGGVVPKREYHLEYNIILRDWGQLLSSIIKDKPDYLRRFRTTPNIRVKFGQELEENIDRGLNTSLPHSDAWVEGPWGMNCYIPLFGDTENNTLKYYYPIEFKDEYLQTSKTYTEMQWVLDYYKPLDFSPEAGKIYVSDYALIHNTNREPKCGTRISIDTTIFIGEHEPHKDRISEYRDKIPQTGIDEFVDAGRYINDKIVNKSSTFSHYTSNSIKTIKL